MSKHTRLWSKNRFEECLQEGRGLGEKDRYKPWIVIQDFSSQGMVSRVLSHKTNRVHHFLSRNELYYFYLLEWSDEVLDIREQFPLLEIEVAMDISKEAGIKYPIDNKSKFPYVLTSDFLITTKNGFKVRTIKNSSDLSNPRTLEKLEIERRYWKKKSVDWAIVTEHEISIQKAKNIEWLHTSAKIPPDLHHELYEHAVFEYIGLYPINLVAALIDKKFNLQPGSGMLIVKNMLWHKSIEIDMNQIMFVS